jgi:holliday junction DNA helicase RuvB
MNSDAIRPTTWATFKGQEDSVLKIRMALDSAKMRKQPLGHVLISGPAGTGKTTFVNIIAADTGHKLTLATGISLRKDTEFFELLKSAAVTGQHAILFIDEIHAIPPASQDNLLTLMEDGRISVRKDGKPQVFALAPNTHVTIVGATTNPGKLNKPVYERFDHKLVFSPYTVSELVDVVKFTVSRLDAITKITDEAALEIAKRSKGVARVATKLAKACQDTAVLKDRKVIDRKVTDATFQIHDIDEYGLSTKVDTKVLKYLFLSYPKPVGIESMAQLIDEDPQQLLGVVEPQLFKLEFIIRQRGGRVITQKGIAYLRSKGVINELDEQTALHEVVS